MKIKSVLFAIEVRFIKLKIEKKQRKKKNKTTLHENVHRGKKELRKCRHARLSHDYCVSPILMFNRIATRPGSHAIGQFFDV